MVSKKNHGIIFHMYQKIYRINQALQKHKEGEIVVMLNLIPDMSY